MKHWGKIPWIYQEFIWKRLLAGQFLPVFLNSTFLLGRQEDKRYEETSFEDRALVQDLRGNKHDPRDWKFV